LTCIHLLLQFGHETAKIAALHIHADDDAALAHFPADLGRAIDHLDIGHIGKPHGSAAGRGDQQIGDRLDAGAVLGGQADDGGKAALALEDFGGRLAADGVSIRSFTSVTFRP
jgi:hypothetical protein